MAFRDRIKEFRMVPAVGLLPDARNWRRHPEAQREALTALLESIGFAGAVIAREDDDGNLVVVDGHLRVDLDADEEVPVLIVDLDEGEAGQVLASFDTLGAMAETDPEALGALLRDVGGDLDEAVLEAVRLSSGLDAEELGALANMDDVLPADDVELVVWAVNVPAAVYDDVVSRAQTLAEDLGLPTSGAAIARAISLIEEDGHVERNG